MRHCKSSVKFIASFFFFFILQKPRPRLLRTLRGSLYFVLTTNINDKINFYRAYLRRPLKKKKGDRRVGLKSSKRYNHVLFYLETNINLCYNAHLNDDTDFSDQTGCFWDNLQSSDLYRPIKLYTYISIRATHNYMIIICTCMYTFFFSFLLTANKYSW